MMRGYAETTGCRRQFLLGYFGEQLDEPCGNCDTCSSGSAYEHVEAVADGDNPFPVETAGRAHRVGPRRRHARTRRTGSSSCSRRSATRPSALQAVIDHDLLQRARRLSPGHTVKEATEVRSPAAIRDSSSTACRV